MMRTDLRQGQVGGLGCGVPGSARDGLTGGATAQPAQPGIATDQMPAFRTPAEEQAVPGQIIVKYEDAVGSPERVALRRREELEEGRAGPHRRRGGQGRGSVGGAGRPRPRKSAQRRVRRA